MKKLALLALAASLTGCVSIEVVTANNTRMKYSAPMFGTKHLKRFQLEKDIFLDGYGSVNSDLATIFSAGIEAGKVLAKP